MPITRRPKKWFELRLSTLVSVALSIIAVASSAVSLWRSLLNDHFAQERLHAELEHSVERLEFDHSSAQRELNIALYRISEHKNRLDRFNSPMEDDSSDYIKHGERIDEVVRAATRTLDEYFRSYDAIRSTLALQDKPKIESLENAQREYDLLHRQLNEQIDTVNDTITNGNILIGSPTQ